MGKLAEAMAEEARPRYLVVGRRFFGIERVDTLALHAVGFAHLEGSGAARQADAELQAERERLAAQEREVAGRKGKAADKVREQIAAARKHMYESRIRATMDDPEGNRAFRQRCDAYICAAVARVGALLPDVALPEYGLIPDGVDPATFAVDLRDDPNDGAPEYSEDLRFVQDKAAASPKDGTVWIGVLTRKERAELGVSIMNVCARSTVREVTPFRRGRRDVPAPASAGGDVPHAAGPARGAGAVADRSGRAVHGARTRRGRGSREGLEGVAGAGGADPGLTPRR